jgi:ABC-type Zn uptake system ZnuABC Zn-binding protein ZnuA
MKSFFILITGLLLNLATARADLNVVASLPDFGAIAEAVGGKNIEVTAIARGSEDPHFVDARPSFVRVLNKADLLIEGGADLEAGWLPTLVTASRNAKIQGTGRGHLVLSRYVKLRDVPNAPVDRSMGDVHPTGNPHYWLDPRNGKIIAEKISATLVDIDPKNTAKYQENYKAFASKLDAKWAEWVGKLEPLRGAKVITYHKSYEYLAAAFGLEVIAQLEPKPGIEPSATHIAHLVRQARNARVQFVIIEPYRPRRAAEQVAQAIGARVVILPDKTGSTPEAKDYISLFDAIVGELLKAAGTAK